MSPHDLILETRGSKSSSTINGFGKLIAGRAVLRPFWPSSRIRRYLLPVETISLVSGGVPGETHHLELHPLVGSVVDEEKSSKKIYVATPSEALGAVGAP